MRRSWDTWHDDHSYIDLLRRRALGELPEMEAAKQMVTLLADTHKPGMSILDAGCGPGHFARSLMRLDPNLQYYGLDLTPPSLAAATEVWREQRSHRFFCGDVFAIPAQSESFDTVACVNLLLCLPEYQKPVEELFRVARHVVLIRLLLGDLTHITKRYENAAAPEDFTYYNVYKTEDVVEHLRRLGASTVEVVPDEFNVALERTGPTSTYTHGDLQINGNVVMTWKWIRAIK